MGRVARLQKGRGARLQKVEGHGCMGRVARLQKGRGARLQKGGAPLRGGETLDCVAAGARALRSRQHCDTVVGRASGLCSQQPFSSVFAPCCAMPYAPWPLLVLHAGEEVMVELVATDEEARAAAAAGGAAGGAGARAALT